MMGSIRLFMIRRARRISFCRWSLSRFFLMCGKSGMRNRGNHRVQNIKRPRTGLHKTFGINTIGWLACELSRVQINQAITLFLIFQKSERKSSLRGVRTRDYLTVLRREALSTRLTFATSKSAHSEPLLLVSLIASILDIPKIRLVRSLKQLTRSRRDVKNSKYRSWAGM